MSWILNDDNESASVKELYTESDRHAAIIAATIVESRLTDAIKNRFTRDEKIEREMFRSSGPLGSFSAKIKIARLIGICSEDAYRDLDYLKEIRNKFAHRLDLRDFSDPQVASWCQNLCMIEKCVWEATTSPLPNPFNVNSLMSIEGREEKFKSPKWRYLITAMLFSSSLQLRRSNGPNI